MRVRKSTFYKTRNTTNLLHGLVAKPPSKLVSPIPTAAPSTQENATINKDSSQQSSATTNTTIGGDKARYTRTTSPFLSATTTILTGYEYESKSGESLFEAKLAGWTQLCTGNAIFGFKSQLGINGYGIYRFADGLTYEGYMRNGKFHGCGTLTFPSGNVISGVWVHGINQSMSFQFADGLQFEEKNWTYCTPADRRWDFHL